MNRESYDAIAERWNAHRIALSSAEERLLSHVVRGLERDSVVLDLGCGSGAPVATHLAGLGFKVHGVDQSSAMIALAKARLPAHRWELAAIETFGFSGKCSAAIAWDSLFHIPRQHHASIFERLRRALPLGGRFALTAGGSDHPAFTDTMFDREFFYDSHPPADTEKLLERAGFRIEHQEFLNLPDGGRDKGRIAVIAIADSANSGQRGQ